MIFSHRVSKNPLSVGILQTFSWTQKLLNYYANGAWTSCFQKKYSFRHYAELTRNNMKILEMSNKVPNIIMVRWVVAFLTCVYKISLILSKKLIVFKEKSCNVRFIKICSTLSSVFLLCLPWIFIKQTLFC